MALGVDRRSVFCRLFRLVLGVAQLEDGLSKKRRRKRELMEKMEIERNRGRVYCTLRGFCEGACRESNLKRFERSCSEAYYLTSDGEVTAKF